MTLLADRFLRRADHWVDLATAERVTVQIHSAGSRSSQIEWAERCAMLVTLRHPMLNPLIDFGAASQTTLFEAFATRDAVACTAAAGSRVITHGSRFLAAHGVRLTSTLADGLVRAFRPGSHPMRARPIGLVLQPRRAWDTTYELLSDTRRGGTTMIAVVSRGAGLGLRTLLSVMAQRARIEGFVPVCADALCRWPELLSALADRHVCLFTSDAATERQRSAAAALLTRLASQSARPHVCVVTGGTARGSPAAIHLDAMGITAMTSMIYLDPDYGPSEQELFEAARRAEGAPGRFLAALGAGSYEPPTSSSIEVHEGTVPYAPSASSPPAAPPGVLVASNKRSRIGSVLWRAGSRAAALEVHGRHAAAQRLLRRAALALEGRKEPVAAARCWLQLAWIARNHGAITPAAEYAARAARTDPTPDGQALAACLGAVCLTDEARFIEAEASLRSVLAAASVLGDARVSHRAALALARVLYWDQRGHEALAAIEPLSAAGDAEVLSGYWLMSSRARLQLGDLSAALQAARRASALAGEAGDLRLRAISSRTMAEVLGAVGDEEGVRLHVGNGIRCASAARLPLLVLRLRAILLRTLRHTRSSPGEVAKLEAALARARRHQLPPLLDRILCDHVSLRPSATPPCPDAGLPLVEDFLDLAQRAKDDGDAVRGVMGEMCERVGGAAAIVLAADGRIVASAGKAWRERSAAAAQALATGQRVAIDERALPAEAAEPVRCGGELIGAIACRWVIGSHPPQAIAAAALRAAAVAVATHLRGLLEGVSVEPSASVFGDLLGDSAVAATLRQAIQRASRAPFPVLIEGESGSGKELVARAIHKLSPRHVRRFCAINCAALSDELIEAELFGHTRGAFTGATTERAGLFEEADGGTLFLDEIGELSARAQAKLLRVLQEGEVRRVGENLPRRVDVRIVAATNRCLEKEAAAGRFRTDLRFRLDVLRIVVPPLRERIGDIPLLAQHFWREASSRVGSQATLGPDAVAALARYDWPGNVRELQNAMAWMAVHAPRRGRVSAALLPAQLASEPMATGTFEAAREEFERRFVRAALAQAGGQRQAAARALGMSRQGLAKMLRRLGIEQEGSV